MSEASSADWLAAFSALMAAAAACGAIRVAKLQLDATRRQTAANLFDQRFKVYRDLTDLSGQLMRGTLSDDDVTNAREAYHFGSALFPASLEPTFKRIFHLAADIQRARARRSSSSNDRPDLDSEIDTKGAELGSLLDAIKRLLLLELREWRGP